MKRYISRFVKAVALSYLGFPIVYLFFVALIFDVPASQCMRVLLSPSYYLLCILAVVTGYGLWEAKRWAWYVFLVTSVLIAYANAVVAVQYSESHHKFLAFLSSVIVLGFIIYRVGREMRVPYFLPRIRWWESDPRYRLSAPVKVSKADGAAVDGEIMDLSMGGCFVKLRHDVAQHESISVIFSIFGVEINCTGVVVWCTPGTVTHPRGIGVKFGPLQRNNRRLLRAITNRLKKIATLYRSSRYLLDQEEFTKRLEALQSEKLNILRPES